MAPNAEFTGPLETHVTIAMGQNNDVEKLHRWGVERGLKCLHIVLERGECVSQPMLTRHARGTLSQQIEFASSVRRELQKDGFAVSRIKIEAAPDNEDVPQTDSAAAEHTGDRYFEHHVKLLLDASAENSPLVSLAQPHSAHLSRNALRKRGDGLEERFVTQRCHGIGRKTARRRLEDLLSALRTSGYSIIDVEEEFVVYDSNLSVDAGWIGN